MYGNITRIATLQAEFRARAAELAALHEVDLVPANRYDATAYFKRESLRLVSKYPVRAATLALAHVLLDWDQRLSAGEPVEQLHEVLSGFEPDDPYTGVVDLAPDGPRDERNTWARQSAGISDPHQWAILVRQALADAAQTWLIAGEYGSDPQAATHAQDTLACLLADGGGADSRHVGVASDNAVARLHLVRGVHILTGEPARVITRPAGGGSDHWSRT
jgi:hypothetical protein